MKLLIRGGSIAASHDVKKCYADILKESLIFDNPNDMDAVNSFYRSLRIMASDLHCELIPAHNYWAGYLEDQNLSSKDLALSDSRYTNEQGHQLIAEAMMKWL